MNYSQSQEEYIIKEYSAEPTRATVDRLSNELEFSTKSIIAKLSNIGIYVKPARLSKNGEPVIRKEDMAKEIGEWFGIDVPTLAKTAKIELSRLYKVLQDPDQVRAHLVDLTENSS